MPIAMTVSSKGRSLSSLSSSSSESSPDQTQCRSPRTIVIPTSNAEEASGGIGEISIPTSPPQFLAMRPMAIGSVTQVVISFVIYAQQMEVGTSTTATTTGLVDPGREGFEDRERARLSKNAG